MLGNRLKHSVVLGLLLMLLSPVFDLITIGILAFRPKEQVLQDLQPLAEHLRQALPTTTVIIKALSYQELEQALQRQQLDFILTNPGHYVTLHAGNAVSGVFATLIEQEGAYALAAMGGTIVTRSDRSDIQRLSDLCRKNSLLKYFSLC